MSSKLSICEIKRVILGHNKTLEITRASRISYTKPSIISELDTLHIRLFICKFILRYLNYYAYTRRVSHYALDYTCTKMALKQLSYGLQVINQDIILTSGIWMNYKNLAMFIYYEIHPFRSICDCCYSSLINKGYVLYKLGIKNENMIYINCRICKTARVNIFNANFNGYS